jgi:hypothetical protein
MQNGSRVEPCRSNILSVSRCCYRACRGWFGDKHLGTITSFREWQPMRSFLVAAQIGWSFELGDSVEGISKKTVGSGNSFGGSPNRAKQISIVVSRT